MRTLLACAIIIALDHFGIGEGADGAGMTLVVFLALGFIGCIIQDILEVLRSG